MIAELTSQTGHASNPTAVVLAGGLGTRLREVISDRPKAMAMVCGRPFITFLLNQIAFAGIETVVICTGHLGEALQTELSSQRGPLKIEFAHEAEQLGTGGALRNALPHLRSDRVLVMNGDSYLTVDLRDYIDQHNTLGASASMLLVRVANANRYGSVTVDRKGKILGIKEKSDQNGFAWINAGIYLLDKSLISNIPVFRKISLEKEIFSEWIIHGLYGFKSEARFIDIGTPESYRQAQDFFSCIAKDDKSRAETIFKSLSR